MDAIRIENLRSLTDTGFVELKPLTLLVGENSSGKSSFLRFFPLLRQSLEDRGPDPISWYGRLVDFGSFEEAVERKSGNEEITFHFRMGPEAFHHRVIRLPPIDDITLLPPCGKTVSCTLRIGYNKIQERGFIKACLFSFENYKINIEFEENRKIKVFQVNAFDALGDIDKEIFYMKSGHILPYAKSARNDFYHESDYHIDSYLFNLIVSEIKKHIKPPKNKNSIRSAVYGFKIETSDASDVLIDSVKRDSSIQWKPHVCNWTTDNSDFKLLRDRMLAFDIINSLNDLDNYVYNFFLDVRYIAPMRATAERYYRVQNMVLNEVDSQGQNLAMIMKNLSSSDQKKFQNWTKEHFGFFLQADLSGGHVSLNVADTSGEIFNLMDMGFGYSQIFPILLQLWFLITETPPTPIYDYSEDEPDWTPIYIPDSPLIFAIEQPELHLHPALQAKLADVFIAAIKLARENNIDLRLIIETHSEVIINRVGHRIAYKELDNEDVNVVLFEKEPAALSTKVSFSAYDKDGFLTNWPMGFLEPDMI